MAVTPEQIQALANSLQITSGAFDDLLAGLVQVNNANQAAANSTLKNVNARTVEAELMQKRNEREQALITLFQTLGGSLTRGITGLGSFTSQLYASTNAFQAASLTLDTFGDIFKSMTKILSDALGPFQRLMGVGTALKNIADAGAEIVISAMKNRIEQARIITDTIQTVGKAGAIFGGSIGEFTESAKRSGINLQEFGKFIANSAKDFVGLGQTLSRSSVMVAELGRQVGNANQDLLVLKGSFGELASSAAEYIALQRLTGVDTRRETNRSAEAIANYIRQQNLLTELTGVSVADQRRQAEERRRIAAFNAAASKLDETSRQNLDTSLTLIGQQFGPQMATIARELFENIENGGQLINEESIRLMQMMPGMLDYVNTMLANISKPTVEFQQNLGKINRDYSPVLASLFADIERSGLLNLQASNVGPAFLRQLQDATVAYQQNKISLDEFDKKVQEAAQAAAKGKTDSGTTAVSQAVKTFNDQKNELDKLARQNLGTLSSIVSATGTIAQKLIAAENEVAKLVNLFANPQQGLFAAMKEFRDKMSEAVQGIFGVTPTSSAVQRPPPDEDQLLRRIRSLENDLVRQVSIQQTLVNQEGSAEVRNQMQVEIDRLRQELIEARYLLSQRRTPQRLPQAGYQEGGIATEPSTVGENNQPEAVIPLARGNIPLNINFEPMIRIMEQQREYLEEILRSTDNNADYLERIYHATA